MKNIKIYFPILAILLLAACSNPPKMKISPNPVAPVLSTPSQATTAYNTDSAAYILNLDSTGIAETFIGTPADYGQSTEVTYSLQIDRAGDNFMHAQTIAAETKDTIPVTVKQLYLAVTGDTLNAPVGQQTAFEFRIMTTIGVGLQPTYSNAVTLKIDPLPALYPYNLVNKLNLWYIIGLGDHGWHFDKADIGNSIFPLGIVTGKEYNKAGDGTFSSTLYIQHSETFKIVSSDFGNWNIQWGSSDGGITPTMTNGGNFQVPSDGWYTITLNSIKNTLSIKAASAPSSTYSMMAVSGDFNGWSVDADPMSAFNASTANNHEWYATVDLTSPNGLKFNYNSWAVSWGSTDNTFPFGIGSTSGGNISNNTGTYKVCFDDISGTYYFISTSK